MDTTQRNRYWMTLIFQLLVYNECETLPKIQKWPNFNWQGFKKGEKNRPQNFTRIMAYLAERMESISHDTFPMFPAHLVSSDFLAS